MADRNALWAQGQDESVEVNQRALIDKVLARYSGEFTVFRELLQNADDAAATSVQIHFETKSYMERNKAQSANSIEGDSALGSSLAPFDGTDKPLPNLKDIVIAQWTFKNNGTVFREEDWNRLKKIAEGNPDEQKIGAFGVGFYSLFSITEEPFVTSGTKWMGFYWRDGKDQLFARRGDLPGSTEVPSPWTTFTLPLRETGPFPGAPLDILRFLVSSITFMSTLKDVELYLDGTRLGHISKEVGSPQNVGVPKSLAAGQQHQPTVGTIMHNAGAMVGGWGDWGMRTPTNNTDTRNRSGGEKEVKWSWLTPRKYFTLTHVTSTPVHIRAEVVRWVYLAGSEKAKPIKKALPLPPSTNAGESAPTNSFLASLISSFASPRSTTPSRPSPFASGRGTPIPTAKPTPSVEKIDLKKVAAEQRKVVESSVLLSVFTAEARVKLDEKMEVELERATKKRAPPTVKVGLIYTGKDEFDASEKEDLDGAEGSKDVGSVFLGLRADLEGNNSSRVYIGHATGQTTGISGHMSARFIPTVERESIDLVDRNVSVWNTELLHIGGYLSRVAYETELSAIARLYTAALQTSASALSGPDANLSTWLQSRCLHALKFFTFRPSTPSPEVSRIMQSAFFSASDLFSIFSSSGVKSASDVRIRSPEMEKFVKALPVLPKEIQDGAADVIALLQGRNMIRQITFDDIIAEMRGRCFEEDEMVECLKWRVSLPRQAAFDAHFKEQFVGAGIFRIAGTKVEGMETTEGDRIVTLGAIRTYVNPGGLVPLDGPFPSTTLPLKFSTTKGLLPTVYPDLFGWSAFSINDWVAYLTSRPPAESPSEAYNVTVSPQFAERVLLAVSKGWNNISKANQEDIVQRLSPLTCVPTQLGLKVPSDAYFSAVHVFPDLPMVTFTTPGAMTGRLKLPTETLLAMMGVRKHVDLQVVFNRMIKTGDWTIAQLVKYLAGVKDTLTKEEIERLKQTAAFSKEEDAVGLKNGERSEVASIATSATTNVAPKKVRYKIGALYEPIDAMRKLKLPILDWGDNPKWRHNSDEAKFLFSLGLQRFPTLPELLKLASGPDKSLRELALNYFFEKHSTQYQDYQPGNFANVAFIPAIHSDGTEFLAKHSQVFSEPGGAVMGFAVIRADIKDEALSKLRITRHPSAAAVTSILLQKPPSSQEQARKVFEYLTSLLGDFTTANLQQLKLSPIIPAETPRSKGMVMVKPMECYFKKDDGETNFHSKLFTFVDFGTRANNFLAACGVRSAPTTEEVAKMLVADPNGFYALTGGAERFKAELRQISASFAEISATTKQIMKRSPILLGTRVTDEREGTKSGQRRGSVGVEEDDDTVIVSYELLRPDQIVIIDDVNTYAQFRDVLYGAPQEDILELLYASLGSPRLGQLIKEEYKPVGELRDAPDAAKIRKLVLERLPLFLHERNQTRVLIRPEWMQHASNFVVKKVARLILQKTLVWGGKRAVKDSEASAAAKREGITRTLTLYIAHNIPLDLYEVANSLCRQMFDTPKVNDSLLFSTILSTDLPSLRRRGYNVDRILNQQKAEKEARESARRAAEREAAQMRPPGAFIDEAPPEVPVKAQGAPPSLPPNKPGSEMPPKPDLPPTLPNGSNDTAVPSIPEKVGKGLFNSVKNKMAGRNSSDDPMGSGLRSGLERLMSSANRPGGGLQPGGPRRNPHGTDKNAQPTPESDINKNVQQAINACRPEARSLLQNREHMETIKEALNEGYCDITGAAVDLVLVGNVANVRVYAARDVPNAQQLLLQTKLDSLNRFLSIVRPLKRVYKLPDSSLHIFYDIAGPLIAFNTNGSLFLNLRYYEGWHDAQVNQKEPMKAMISWFFTLAHEIAHNLVGPHNAEHSYYMNQISSTHILSLVDELQAVQFGIGAQ